MNDISHLPGQQWGLTFVFVIIIGPHGGSTSLVKMTMSAKQCHIKQVYHYVTGDRIPL